MLSSLKYTPPGPLCSKKSEKIDRPGIGLSLPISYIGAASGRATVAGPAIGQAGATKARRAKKTDILLNPFPAVVI